MTLFDCHVHVLESPETLEKVEEIEEINLIIMSTKREEWAMAKEFANSKKHVIGFGIHPWFAHLHSQNDDLRDLEENLVANQLAIIGEIGLDKAAVDYETKEKFNWDHQVEIFVAQMELAVKLQRPVSVHSVQSHGFLLEYFQKLETTCKAAYAIDPTTLPCPPSIMLHSFSASKEKTFERIVATPETQLLIESDVHNVLDVPVAMQNAVDMVATAKSWNHQKVVEVTTRNALRFLQRL